MRFVLFFFIFGSCFAMADDGTHEFVSTEQEQRYQSLIKELRCPKCQNQSIADSNAGISEDLREIVYEKVQEGKTDEEIRLFLKERYGDFILYKPELSGANLFLWLGPFIFIVPVIVIIVFRVKRAKQKVVDDQALEQAEKLIQQVEQES